MKITQKSIRSTKRLLNDIEKNQKFLLGLKITTDIENIIYSKLNVVAPTNNKRILPSPLLGKISAKNSDGEYVPNKNREKETAYRAQTWELTAWDGKVHSGTGYVPYQRYPRDFIAPKEFELIIKEQENEKYICIYKEFEKSLTFDPDIKFATNLMLEIFGEVDVFSLDTKNRIVNNIESERVDWEVLPQGTDIWEKIKNVVEGKSSTSEITLIKKRIDWLYSKKPTSIKEGIGGYTGYLVFEFEEKNLYVMDSMLYGKATYIFENEWETVSKMTKKEIIENNLAKERVIHNKHWKNKLNEYL